MIDKAGAALAEAAGANSTVILFGSYARGDEKPDSDFDFLVIEPGVEDRFRESARLGRLVGELGVPADVVVVSEDDVREGKERPGTMIHHALLEGRVVGVERSGGGDLAQLMHSDTSFVAVRKRLGTEPGTLAEFEAEYGPTRPPDGDGVPRLTDLIERAGTALAEAAGANAKVILFGSYARGEERTDSDVDFLVIEPAVEDHLEERDRLRRALGDFPLPVDIVVLEQALAARRAKVPGTMVHHALRDGRVFIHS